MNSVLAISGWMAILAEPAFSMPPDTSAEAIGADSSSEDSGWEPLLFRSYKNNYLGYTLDEDDEGFMDFQISVQYPLKFIDKGVFDRIVELCDGCVENHAYFAFTGRFGQYIGTRESSPVIGKQFNPFLFEQFRKEHAHWSWILRVGYAHESNGQEVDDTATYNAFQRNYSRKEESDTRDQFAKDLISRGWDYIGVDFSAKFWVFDEAGTSLKFILSDGLLQGPKEDYREWEDLSGVVSTQRSHLQGLHLFAETRADSFKPFWWFRTPFLRLAYETGIYRPFMVGHSVKAEGGGELLHIPFLFWTGYGHQSDLAQFGKRVFSWGAAVRLSSFSDPFF